MTYTPTKLDEALELEIKAAGLCIEYFQKEGDSANARFWEQIQRRRISIRSTEYIRYLEEQRGLV